MTTKKAHARKPLLKRYKLVLDSTQPILDLMIDGCYVISLRSDGTLAASAALDQIRA